MECLRDKRSVVHECTEDPANALKLLGLRCLIANEPRDIFELIEHHRHRHELFGLNVRAGIQIHLL